MARIVKVLLTDDLEAANGNKDVEGHEQLRFAIDGRMYDIDLTADNAAQLRSILKPYMDAGRESGHVPGRTDLLKRSARRTARQPATTASTSTEARACAVEHRPIPEEDDGRLAAQYIEANRAFQAGDHGPLNKFLAIPHQSEEGDADWNPDGDEPVKQLDHSAAEDAAARVEASLNDGEKPEPTTELDAESEALNHYQPITRSARMADPKKWERRTGHGCERTDKIGDWTLVERIDALTDQNLTILGMLTGEIELPKSGNVTRLKISEGRLENLEFIQEDATSRHGWAITDFGRYAYKVRTAQAA
ncbi:histone-like nucleoid-structuring protein Lsr2 [Streptomyces sp. NPDC005499]|uniref:Lsr2 dimerization domain-containing protein n=1 Tax=Streptomyces sp. NPDC005499 TaxID=3154883 RepID=UPI0033B01262